MPLYQRVFYVTPGEPVEVQPQANIPTTPWQSPFLVRPYNMAYNEYQGPGRFALQAEGLVAIIAYDQTPPWGSPYSNKAFRYVTKPDGSVTPRTFFEAIAAMTVFGVGDEALSVASRIETMKSRKVALRCGPTIEVAASLATTAGLTTRTVHLLNVSTEDLFDDGHVLIECQQGTGWVLYDVNGDVAHAATYAMGDFLSLGAVIDRGVTNCWPTALARSEGCPQGYPSAATGTMPGMDVYVEYQYATPARRDAWRQAVYEIPGIDLNGKTYWGLKPEKWSAKAEVEAYAPGSWIAMPWADWVAKFYPNGL